MGNYINILYYVLSVLMHAYVTTLLSVPMHIMCDKTSVGDLPHGRFIITFIH